MAGFIAAHGGWITESNFHADAIAGQYFMCIDFMCIEVRADSLPFLLTEFRERFASIAAELEMD